MKDAVLTVRVTSAVRKRVERLARREGRSLSGQVQRMLEQAMQEGSSAAGPRVRSLAGILAGGRTPTLADFEDVRGALSASLSSRAARAERRR